MRDNKDTRPVDDPDTYIVAVAGLLGIPLEPAWMGPIAANLAVLRAAATHVGEFPLPDEAEPAPVYAA